MFGGIETTEGMIANAILHLLAHPEQRALVEADRGLLSNAVEESLRLEPAAAVIDRYATRDVRLGRRVDRRSGELVTISIAGANRDPDVFPDPERFDVRRDNARRQVAFAARASRLHRHASRAPGGAHSDRAPARSPPGPAPRSREPDRAAGPRFPKAAGAPRGLGLAAGLLSLSAIDESG